MKFKAELVLANVNMRIEKAGDKDEGAVDLKLSHDALPIDKLKGIFATEVAFQTCIARFYRDDGELVTPDIGVLEIAHEGIGVDATVKSAFGEELDFTDRTNINKFKVKLLSGRRCEFSCRLQIHPDPDDVAQLYQLQGQGVTLSTSWKKTAAMEEADREKQRELDVERKEAEEEGAPATVQ